MPEKYDWEKYIEHHLYHTDEHGNRQLHGQVIERGDFFEIEFKQSPYQTLVDMLEAKEKELKAEHRGQTKLV